VPIDETVRGFREILEGKHDDLPEEAFYMIGNIEEAVERGREMTMSDEDKDAEDSE
jgi:F-type H+-transporting ATPase subunit beta